MLVIFNANIPTFNSNQPMGNAIAIDNAHIIAIGDSDEILNSFPDSDKYDANGFTVLPGLVDAHIHLQAYALSLQKVDCETGSQAECLRRVAQKAEGARPGEWVLGHGWNQNNWPEGYGTADQLDQITSHNPVYLTHKSLHCGWANTQALHLAGITLNTADPENGIIGRHEDGNPDGLVFESAMELVENAIPEPGFLHVVDAIQAAQTNLLKMGLTGVHDFDHQTCFSALQILHQEHELKLRVMKSIPYENLQSATNLGLRTGFGDDLLLVGPVKLFADGALGPHTAAMHQPYEDDPTNLGMLMLDAEAIFDIGQLAVSNGISLAVHAIGDRANHEVLNGYAKIREFERSNHIPRYLLRHRIEHVQVIAPQDIRRFSELNIIASMQPIHATSDMLMADQFWGSRSEHAYAWQEQVKAGNMLLFGSDAPVESPNPFWGIHAAVTRRRADGTPAPEGWYPNQRLTIPEALKAYTYAPAFAAHMEDSVGCLAPGYLADLIIVDKDPFVCHPGELLNLHSLATMVNGRWLFSEI